MSRLDRKYESRISLFYQNVRGLRTKTRAFFKSVSAAQYNIVVLTETWLSDQQFDNEVFPPKFNVCRYDRKSSIGGGVIIATDNESFSSEHIDLNIINGTELEYVCVKIAGERKSVFIYAFYIPPNSGNEVYQGHMEAIDGLKMSNTDTLMVIGDANAANIQWTRNNHQKNCFAAYGKMSNVYADFIQFFPCRNLFQMIDRQNHAGNVLDLCYSTEPELTTIEYPQKALSYPIDPHHTHFELSFDLETAKKKEPVVRSVWAYHRTDFESMVYLLGEESWEHVLSATSVNDAFDCFYDVMAHRKNDPEGQKYWTEATAMGKKQGTTKPKEPNSENEKEN